MCDNCKLLERFIVACRVVYGDRVVIDLEPMASGRWWAKVTPPRGFWSGSNSEVFIVKEEVIDFIYRNGGKQ